MAKSRFEKVKTAFEEAQKAIANAITYINRAGSALLTIEPTWRNVRSDYWLEICKHYDEDKLLNCYGDVFYIEDEQVLSQDEKCYIGRRVLWGFGLSKEVYEITEENQYGADGEFEHKDYIINVLGQ